jgi:hypothetical protein
MVLPNVGSDLCKHTRHMNWKMIIWKNVTPATRVCASYTIMKCWCTSKYSSSFKEHKYKYIPLVTDKTCWCTSFNIQWWQKQHPLYSSCFLPHRTVWITNLWLGGWYNRFTPYQHELPKQLYHATLPPSYGFWSDMKMKSFFHKNYHLIHPDTWLTHYVSTSILKKKSYKFHKT